MSANTIIIEQGRIGTVLGDLSPDSFALLLGPDFPPSILGLVHEALVLVAELPGLLRGLRRRGPFHHRPRLVADGVHLDLELV